MRLSYLKDEEDPSGDYLRCSMRYPMKASGYSAFHTLQFFETEEQEASEQSGQPLCLGSFSMKRTAISVPR